MKAAMLACLVILAACGKDAAAPPQPAPDPGKMHVHISGAVESTTEWHAFGEFRDLLASEVGDLSLLSGENIQPSAGDSTITVAFPARLDVGHFVLGASTAFVRFDSTVYLSLAGGTLDVDSAGYPERPGLLFGVVRGTLSFKAVRAATNDTITVEAAFAETWGHRIFPNVSVTLSGAGPVAGTSQFTTAQSLDDEHGGRLVEMQSDFSASHVFPHDISQELRILAPSVGTFTLPATTPVQFAHAASWPSIYAALFYRDDPRLGLSTGGTLTVTDLLQPTDEYYGEIHGTLTSRLALWSDSTTLSGDSVDASITFAVQLWPLGGIPATSRPEARSSARTPAGP